MLEASFEEEEYDEYDDEPCYYTKFMHFIGKMNSTPPKWTIAKIISCINVIYVNKSLSKCSFDELKIGKSDVFFDREKVRKVVDYLYNKCKLRPDFYGSSSNVEEMVQHIEMYPEIHKSLTIEQLLQTEIPRLLISTNEVGLFSKQDMVLGINYIMKLTKYTNIAYMFLAKWIVSFLTKGFDSLKGTYTYLPISVMQMMFHEFYEKVTELPFVRPLKIEHFLKLRSNFRKSDSDGLTFFDKVFMKQINMLNEKWPIATNQHLYVTSYVQIQIITTRCKHVYKKILKPLLICDIEEECAAVRIFHINGSKIIFAQELEETLQVAMAKRYPEKKYPSGMFPLDNYSKKTGIITGVTFEKFQTILRILKLSPDTDIRCINISECSQYPLVSPYGTLCKSSLCAFNSVIEILTVNLKIFQGMKRDKLWNVVVWLEQFEPLFGRKKFPWFIENWKIEEISNRIRDELLQVYVTEFPIYDIPPKPSYKFKDVLTELKKLLGDLATEAEIYQFLNQEMRDKVKQMGYKSVPPIYCHYRKFVLSLLCQISNKIDSFTEVRCRQRFTAGNYEDVLKQMQNMVNQQNQNVNRPVPKWIFEVRRKISDVREMQKLCEKAMMQKKRQEQFEKAEKIYKNRLEEIERVEEKWANFNPKMAFKKLFSRDLLEEIEEFEDYYEEEEECWQPEERLMIFRKYVS